MTTTTKAFRRPNGRIGIRNHVAILSAMDNTNATANRVAQNVQGTIALMAPFGRTQIGDDFEITLRTLAGIAMNPNVASVLVLSIEQSSAKRLADRIMPSAKPVKYLGLQDTGSTTALTEKATCIAVDMVLEASET